MGVIREQHTLDIKAEVATGTAATVKEWIDKWIQITGTFDATLVVEGTIDGTNYETIDTLTAPGLIEVPEAYRQVRVDTTIYASGTPAGVIVGRNAETM